ncbi:MAG: hypothetical protein F6K28_42200 [Microcoleus sp. SIO2G3]|nr:hypothetical protein [Microcoleus sp. SIO2G3]
MNLRSDQAKITEISGAIDRRFITANNRNATGKPHLILVHKLIYLDFQTNCPARNDR